MKNVAKYNPPKKPAKINKFATSIPSKVQMSWAEYIQASM